MAAFDIKPFLERFASLLSEEDSPTVQGVLLHLMNETGDMDYNVQVPSKTASVKLNVDDEEGVIVLHLTGLYAVSLRTVRNLYKNYSRIISITTNTPSKKNVPLTVTVTINKANQSPKAKEVHVPKADNQINTIQDGLRWTGRDLENIKGMEKDVIDMDLDMVSPKWQITDRGSTYILIATPIHSTNIAFYDYMIKKHVGVIENIVYRTDSDKPAADAAPRFEIYCHRTRKTTLEEDPAELFQDNADLSDLPIEEKRPRKKVRRNNYYEG